MDRLDAAVDDGSEGGRDDYTLDLLAVLLRTLEDADSSVDSWVDQVLVRIGNVEVEGRGCVKL